LALFPLILSNDDYKDELTALLACPQGVIGPSEDDCTPKIGQHDHWKKNIIVVDIL
jgi:hypothetical protein